MLTAVVTGASSGIGLEISKYFAENGYIVYGIGRNFRYNYEHKNIIKKEFDLLKINDIPNIIKEIKGDVKVLVNCAGVGYFAPHEQLNIKKIHQMTTLNIEVPMILSQLLLRKLKATKGFIINIASVTAKKSNTYGCAYGATKAGIANFGQSLFDENRKYGLKVCTIFPDMTKTDFYRNTYFECADNEQAYIKPESIAAAVKFIIESPSPVTEIVIRPQKHQIKKMTEELKK